VVASYLPPAQGEALLNMARAAFVDAMGAAVLVGAIVAIGGAIVAFAFLPGRSAALAAGATTTAGGAEAPALVPAELEPAA
jgi:DHA2 family integral membrane protein (MFS transporter)